MRCVACKTTPIWENIVDKEKRYVPMEICCVIDVIHDDFFGGICSRQRRGI
jgi:hypothetical protein